MPSVKLVVIIPVIIGVIVVAGVGFSISSEEGLFVSPLANKNCRKRSHCPTSDNRYFGSVCGPNAIKVSLKVSGGITSIVKFTWTSYIANRWIFFGYLKLWIYNSSYFVAVAVSGVVVGDVDVVDINIEATIGIVYTPTGVCGETSTLNNGG